MRDSKGNNIHFPLYVHLGRFSIQAHLLLETLGYTIGFLAFRRLRKKLGDAVSDATRWSVITAGVAGAAIGSRVLFWFEDPRLTSAHWHDAVYLMSGKTIVGGLIGGLFAVEWVKRRIGEESSTGDLFAAPIALGLAIGRIGCFLGGLPDNTYGRFAWRDFRPSSGRVWGCLPTTAAISGDGFVNGARWKPSRTLRRQRTSQPPARD